MLQGGHSDPREGRGKEPILEFTHLNPEDGSNMFHRNVGIHLQNYTISQPG
jgi:hypothetical protein